MSAETKSINVTISPTWDLINEIEMDARKMLEGQDEVVVDAVIMALTEIIENAIKYGKGISKEKGIDFVMDVDDKITIKVSNGVIADDNAQCVIGNIEKIKASDNPMELYTQRLMELMENPINQGESQLGLYRIAYEGKFNLDYIYENDIITIIAERPIK